MQRRQSSKTPKQSLQAHSKNQTDLSAWRKEGRTEPEESVQNHQSPKDQKNDSNQYTLDQALSYFEKGKSSFKVSYLKKNITTFLIITIISTTTIIII